MTTTVAHTTAHTTAVVAITAPTAAGRAPPLPITYYGWQQPERVPLSSEQQAQVAVAEEAIEDWLVVKPATVLLTTTILIPTQLEICPTTLAELDQAEDLPPILVIVINGRFYIHDGHHRATRCRLRGGDIEAVVVRLS